MKTTFFSLIFSLISFFSFAQMSELDRQHLMVLFPNYNPDYIWENSKVVDIKTTPKGLVEMSYLTPDSSGRALFVQWMKGAPRIGDKVRVFGDKKATIAFKNESTGSLMRPIQQQVQQQVVMPSAPQDAMYPPARQQKQAPSREEQLAKAERNGQVFNKVLGMAGRYAQQRNMNGYNYNNQYGNGQVQVVTAGLGMGGHP